MNKWMNEARGGKKINIVMTKDMCVCALWFMLYMKDTCYEMIKKFKFKIFNVCAFLKLKFPCVCLFLVRACVCVYVNDKHAGKYSLFNNVYTNFHRNYNV